jgi:hypothetical protein
MFAVAQPIILLVLSFLARHTFVRIHKDIQTVGERLDRLVETLNHHNVSVAVLQQKVDALELRVRDLESLINRRAG